MSLKCYFFHNICPRVCFSMCYSIYDFREDVVMVWQKGSFAVDGKIKLKAPTLPFECFFFFRKKAKLSTVFLLVSLSWTGAQRVGQASHVLGEDHSLPSHE